MTLTGLITNLPSTNPTITPATGPSNGIFDIPKHKDEPNNAVISGELSWSTDKTVLITMLLKRLLEMVLV